MTKALRVYYKNINNDQSQYMNFKLPDNVKNIEKIDVIEIETKLDEKVISTLE